MPNLSNAQDSLEQSDWSSLTRELLDTLPRTWTRGLVYLVIAFTGVALPWAMTSQVDETGSAQGRMEPEGKATAIDAPVDGTVEKVMVQAGQSVKKGQILLQLDGELTRTQIQETAAKVAGLRNQLAQLQLIENQLIIALQSQRSQIQAQAAAQQAQIEQTMQKLNSSRREAVIVSQRVANDEAEVQRYTPLVQEGIVAEVKLVEVEQQLNTNQQSLEQTQTESAQAEYELERQRSSYDSKIYEGQRLVLQSQNQVEEIRTQIADVRSQLAQLQQQLESLHVQLQQKIIRSPINGVVFEMSINHPGAVLEASEPIARIAPENADLMFRAEMPTQESSFLQVGRSVKLKFDAYPFQDYGIVQGRVHWISPDSRTIETAQGPVQTFELEIELDQPHIQSRGERVILSAGQTGTAEIIIHQRRVIDFILDPFKKLSQEGLKL